MTTISIYFWTDYGYIDYLRKECESIENVDDIINSYIAAGIEIVFYETEMKE